MKNSFEVSVIIPAYNEEEGIALTLRDIVDLGLDENYEIVVVNDGSQDGTGKVASEFANVNVINHRVNKGYGAALKSGIRSARGRKVVIMDSDGQHSAKYINEVVNLLNEYQMVIGERTVDSHQVKSRMIGKCLVRWIGEYLTGQILPDFNSGFRGFDRRVILSMLSIMPNGFSFSTTSTLAFMKRGYEIATIPIHVDSRVGRKSNVKFIKDGSKTILLIFRIVMLFNPLKIFFPASMLTGLTGLLWAIYGIVLIGRIPNSALLIVIFAMLLFFIGLLADQISMLNLRMNEAQDESK